MTGRPRARRGEGDALREEILGAAARLLAETESEDAVSLRAVASAVGVTTPSIYRHFADKEALVAAVCAQVFADLDTAMEHAATSDEDPMGSLRERGLAYVRFALANPEHYRLVMMRRPDATDARVLGDLLEHTMFRHVRDAVQRCQGAGVFAAGHDPTQLGLALWAAAHGIASLLISHPALSADAERLTELAIMAIGTGLVHLDPAPCAVGGRAASPPRRGGVTAEAGAGAGAGTGAGAGARARSGKPGSGTRPFQARSSSVPVARS